MQTFRTAPASLTGTLAVAFCAGFLDSYCSQKSPTEPTPEFSPQISNLIAPTLLYNQSQRDHLISVRVEDPQGPSNIRDVVFEIVKVGETQAGNQGDLYDDGSHGDVIARDGSYSNIIKGSAAQGDSGQFQLRVIATDRDGNSSEPLTSQLFILNGQENQSPQILEASVPATVPVDSTHDFVIAVRVADADGNQDIRQVNYGFFPPQHPTATVEGELLDNGADGDTLANDGVYAAILSSDIITELAEYHFRFQALDASGNLSNPLIASLRGREPFSAAPRITAVSVPRIVNSNTTPSVVITATATDPDGLADIDSVWFRMLLNGEEDANTIVVLMADDGNTSASGDANAGDGAYSARLNLQGGSGDPLDYQLEFNINDASGVHGEQVFDKFVHAYDDAPYISDLQAPDMVIINPNAPTRLRITLDVRDPQGLDDIVLAHFRAFLPDGAESQDSPIILLDNGDNARGDLVAGDGIFSRFVNLPSQGVEPGDYLWIFLARDAGEHESNVIRHTLVVPDVED